LHCSVILFTHPPPYLHSFHFPKNNYYYYLEKKEKFSHFLTLSISVLSLSFHGGTSRTQSRRKRREEEDRSAEPPRSQKLGFANCGVQRRRRKMPLSKYCVRNEYSLADPELCRAADKDDPEALLEAVAMAGLVGLLRQLGDLAESVSSSSSSYYFVTSVFLSLC